MSMPDEILSTPDNLEAIRKLLAEQEAKMGFHDIPEECIPDPPKDPMQDIIDAEVNKLNGTSDKAREQAEAEMTAQQAKARMLYGGSRSGKSTITATAAAQIRAQQAVQIQSIKPGKIMIDPLEDYAQQQRQFVTNKVRRDGWKRKREDSSYSLCKDAKPSFLDRFFGKKKKK